MDVDGYTKTPNQREISEKRKKQPAENPKNYKTEIQAKWGPGLHLAGQWSQIFLIPFVSYSTATNTLNIN